MANFGKEFYQLFSGLAHFELFGRIERHLGTLRIKPPDQFTGKTILLYISNFCDNNCIKLKRAMRIAGLTPDGVYFNVRLEVKFLTNRNLCNSSFLFRTYLPSLKVQTRSYSTFLLALV